MISSDLLDVLLQVPEHIRHGLAEGTLTAWGGTIRDQQGRIRALLVEGRGLEELARSGIPLDPKSLSDALGSAIGHVETATNLAAGLSALNLGVNLAGFAMIQRKLEALAEQLNHLLLSVAQVKEDVSWFGSIQIAQLRADVDTACEVALRAHRTRDPALFKEAQTRAHQVRRTLHHTMAMMVETERTVARHVIFGEFAQASAVLCVVEARCAEANEGAEQALRVFASAREDLDRLMAEFKLQITDFRVDPETRIRLGDEGRMQISALTEEMGKVTRQLEGAAGRLALQQALGMTSDEWSAWSAPEGSGLVTCIAPAHDDVGDLIELARRGPG
jgi:hypothetical protein